MAKRGESTKVIPLRKGNRAPAVERVAAIDIGSNSIRAIVADVDSSGTIRVIDELKDAPRLGAGLEISGMLDPAAIRRAADAVFRMATLARAHGASRVEAVATSAVREASNADEFVDLVQQETNLRVRILEGDDEARLGYRSALAHFDLGVGRWAVVDIGGGSLELALSADGLVERLVSLPLGAIRLTERFLSQECSRRDVRALRRHVREALRVRLPAREWRGAKVIGSGGTFTNLAGMYLARQEIVTAQTVHGTRVSRVDLEHILDALQDTTLAERQRFPGLNMARADIIVAGVAVIAEVMARLDAHELTVSGYGIREGLLLETARVVPAIANPGEARGRSVRRLAEACHYEEPHSHHVQELALQLFDSLGERLGLASSDRQTLADAALLHDIGYHISYDKHHKHSYYLVLHAELLGMSPAEQVVVANVARYHRGKGPRKKQGNFGALDKATRKRIKRLAAILRVADGFDRGHVRNVERIKVRWSERSLRLTPVPREPGQSLRLELWGANRKADLLADLVDVPVEIVSPGGGVVGVDDLPASAPARAESGD
ncbi:MAG TPA: Ppx/GppA phosphatase family protein [Gemmatimonadaceae bacterium]|nr:Ppx/GppA phosphatase family protein [Gemmatimonadaceae bacterium]